VSQSQLQPPCAGQARAPNGVDAGRSLKQRVQDGSSPPRAGHARAPNGVDAGRSLKRVQDGGSPPKLTLTAGASSVKCDVVVTVLPPDPPPSVVESCDQVTISGTSVPAEKFSAKLSSQNCFEIITDNIFSANYLENTPLNFMTLHIRSPKAKLINPYSTRTAETIS
jgi:hypothetical protein